MTDDFDKFIQGMSIIKAKDNITSLNLFFEKNLIASRKGSLTEKALADGVYYENRIDDNTEKESLYISYGRFEDMFLNNMYISKENPKKYSKFDVSFNNVDSYVRYSDKLRQLQHASLDSYEDLPMFLYPFISKKIKSWYPSETGVSYNIKRMREAGIKTMGEGGTYPQNIDDVEKKIGSKAIPLRELFINCNLIAEAFSAKNNIFLLHFLNITEEKLL